MFYLFINYPLLKPQPVMKYYWKLKEGKVSNLNRGYKDSIKHQNK